MNIDQVYDEMYGVTDRINQNIKGLEGTTGSLTSSVAANTESISTMRSDISAIQQAISGLSGGGEYKSTLIGDFSADPPWEYGETGTLTAPVTDFDELLVVVKYRAETTDPWGVWYVRVRVADIVLNDGSFFSTFDHITNMAVRVTFPDATTIKQFSSTSGPIHYVYGINYNYVEPAPEPEPETTTRKRSTKKAG